MLHTISPSCLSKVTGSAEGWGQCKTFYFCCSLFLFPHWTMLFTHFPLFQKGSSVGCSPSEVPLPQHVLLTDCSPLGVSLLHSGFPAVLQDYLLLRIALSSMIASLAMPTMMTLSTFSSAPSVSLLLCPLHVFYPSRLPFFLKRIWASVPGASLQICLILVFELAEMDWDSLFTQQFKICLLQRTGGGKDNLRDHTSHWWRSSHQCHGGLLWCFHTSAVNQRTGSIS